VWTASNTVAPSSNSHARGEICWHVNASLGGFAGSICTTTGTPGTWVKFGPIVADAAEHMRDIGLKRSGAYTLNNTTTFFGHSDLSDDLALGEDYTFRAVLDATCNASGGIKVRMSGTAASTTTVRYNVWIYDGGALVAHGRHTALDGETGITAVTAPTVVIEGVIGDVTTAGTLRPEFTQNAMHASDLALLTRSTFQVTNRA
jgi:hypothetical protein